MYNFLNIAKIVQNFLKLKIYSYFVKRHVRTKILVPLETTPGEDQFLMKIFIVEQYSIVEQTNNL